MIRCVCVSVCVCWVHRSSRQQQQQQQPTMAVACFSRPTGWDNGTFPQSQNSSSSSSLLFLSVPSLYSCVCVCVCVCVFHGLWPLLWHLATLCGIRWGFLARICTSSSFLIDLINLNKSKKWKQCAHEASLSKFPRSIQRLRRWNNYGSGFIAIPIDGMDSGAGSCRRGP